MANKIFAVQTKDTVISTGLMTETYGDEVPTGKFATATFEANGNLTAIAKAATAAINDLSVNDNLLIIVPNVAFKSLIKVFIDAAYKGAPNGAKAVTALTPAQQKAFDQSYKDALVKFADAVIAHKGQVRLSNSLNLYRYQLVATPDAQMLTAGQKITFTNGTGKEYATSNGYRVIGTQFMANCEHTVETRGEEYYVSHMINVGGKYVTTVEALKKFRNGEFTPEHDGTIRLINQLMLNAIVSSKLPKVATVSRDFGAATN